MAVFYAAPTYRVISASLTNRQHADDLQTALNRAGPGDEVLLLPGRYPAPAVMCKSGTAEAPIIIRPARGGEVILDGGRTREDGRNGMLDPLDGDFAFLRLFGVRHLLIDGLSFENCWPTAIYMRSCRDVTIRNCRGEGGRFFIYARQTDTQPTRDLQIEGCAWVQDPDHDMWDGRVLWEEVKGRPQFYDASFFNGAFFGSFDIEGRLTIRDCDISHAFNAIRMDMRDEHVSGRGPTVARNRDVAIHNNRMAFIRDNAVEPEGGAQNWYVFNNCFYNIHACFSLDGVVSRDLFYIANWILNDRRPGLPGQEYQGGKIFKFLKRAEEGETDPELLPRPRRGLWSLFNSVQTRTSYAKRGATRNWTDANTLLGLFPENFPEDCSVARAAFKDMAWHDGVAVTAMVCSEQGFVDKYTGEGAQIDGVWTRPVFDIPAFDRDPSLPLGGWDGVLTPLPAEDWPVGRELKIRRADGPDLIFAAGLSPGARDISVFGLRGWPFDGASAST